jgi:hypothetical protein
MMLPDTELRFINAQIGYGVVATRPIPKGCITWVQDKFDLVFAPQQLKELRPVYAKAVSKYAFANARGEYVLCWDLARYVNHSCHPTRLRTGYNFEIAVKDIAAGQELTGDYASPNLEDSFACHCQARRCRRIIHATDIYSHAEGWDKAVRETFPLIAATPQPLWPLVLEKQAVDAAIAGAGEIASCKVNLHGYQSFRAAV